MKSVRKVIVISACLAGLCACLYNLYFYLDVWRVRLRLPALIAQVAAAYNLDPLLITSIVIEESGMNYRVKGRAGEIGLMQVTPLVLKDYEMKTGYVITPNELFDPEVNLHIGCWYLSLMLKQFSEQQEPIYFALAAYNAGASNVQRWIGNNKGLSGQEFLKRIGFKSTRTYVENIIRRWAKLVQREARSAALGRRDSPVYKESAG